MEISRYCFNFVFSAEQSTFILFSKLEVLRSAPITKLNMYDFLWLLLWTSFKIKVWSQFYHNNNNNNNNNNDNDNDNNNLLKKKATGNKTVIKPLLLSLLLLNLFVHEDSYKDYLIFKKQAIFIIRRIKVSIKDNKFCAQNNVNMKIMIAKTIC